MFSAKRRLCHLCPNFCCASSSTKILRTLRPPMLVSSRIPRWSIPMSWTSFVEVMRNGCAETSSTLKRRVLLSIAGPKVCPREDPATKNSSRQTSSSWPPVSSARRYLSCQMTPSKSHTRLRTGTCRRSRPLTQLSRPSTAPTSQQSAQSATGTLASTRESYSCSSSTLLLDRARSGWSAGLT